jgi:hypothetical protein
MKTKKSLPILLVASMLSIMVFQANGADVAKQFTGCVSKKSGVLRISTTCQSSETKVTFAGQGVAGPKGENGKDGESGVQGIQGAVGAAGQDGQDGISGTDGTNAKDGVDGLNGKDGAAGIAGPRGETGKTTANAVYNAYIKSQDVVVSGSPKKVIVLRVSDLKIPLTGNNISVDARAYINIDFQNSNSSANCSWQGPNWQSSDLGFGNFAYGYAVAPVKRVSMSIEGIAEINQGQDLFLTCSLSAGATISSGWVGVSQIDSQFAQTIGG